MTEYMTPQLDRYLDQWRLYKRAFILFLCINLFSVFLSLVLGIQYFGTQRNFGERERELIKKMQLADVAMQKLNVFAGQLRSRDQLHVKTHEDEKVVIHTLSSWQEILGLAEQLGIQMNRDFSPLIDTREAQSAIADFSSSLTKIKTEGLNDLKDNFQKYHSNIHQLILTGILTLLFGFILPTYLLYFIGRTLNRIRLEVQNSILTFLNNWTQTQSRYGENAFRNVEFWLQILLLLGQQAGLMSRHPAAQVASELAYIIRLELQKKNQNQTAA